MRPDALDLIGPDFDREPQSRSVRTLIICSAPRTGSYELCRYLLAAGIGVPHEYFNPNYSRRIAKRWGLNDASLVGGQLALYIDLLRGRRANGGVFAFKLMYPHFERSLRNQDGAALFEGATIVHLFRPNVTAQFKSFRGAIETGLWDFSDRHTRAPQRHQRDSLRRALRELELLVSADLGFRRLFVLLNAYPLFVTTDELFSDPVSVVHKIAGAVGASIDLPALEQMIALGAPYFHAEASRSVDDLLTKAFRESVFRTDSCGSLADLA